MYVCIPEYEMRQVAFAFDKTLFCLQVQGANFPGFSMTCLYLSGFPGLDSIRSEIHDFPGFPYKP